MFSTVKVRGKKAHPFYKKLKEESGVEPTWNFNKYLISKNGKVISTFKSGVKPDSPRTNFCNRKYSINLFRY